MDTTSMVERLEGDYRQVFERAELYCCTMGIAEDIEADKLMNLFDVLLTAQTNGKPVEKIIGKDIKKFCECYFEDYNIRERICHMPPKIYRGAWVVFIFSLLELFFECDWEQGLSWTFCYQTDILPYVVGISTGWLFSAAIRICIKPLIFRFPRIAPMKFYISYLVMFAVLVFVAVQWEEHMQASVLIPILPVIVICGIYIALYWGVRAYRRYQNHGSIRKERDKEEGWEHSSKFMLEIGDTLVKRFHRINRRRVRRGKEAWTPEEYMEQISRKDGRDAVVWRVMAVFYVLIMAVPIAMSLLNEGLEDALILGAVLVAIEVPIYMLCRKASGFGVRCRKKIMEECSSRGEDLLEYMAYLREQSVNRR